MSDDLYKPEEPLQRLITATSWLYWHTRMIHGDTEKLHDAQKQLKRVQGAFDDLEQHMSTAQKDTGKNG